MEDPPKKFFRLAPGREVRLRYAYFITCTGVVKDAAGNVTELRCTYDPATRGGDSPDGRKVKGTIHWVSAEHAVDAEVRLYDRLFTVENPAGANISRPSQPAFARRRPRREGRAELASAAAGTSVQFERLGYFCVGSDPRRARRCSTGPVSLPGHLGEGSAAEDLR